MKQITVLLATLLLVSTPLAGCLDDATLEELIDDIVGCMDAEAKNYDDNATTELVGNCIYAASMDVFMNAMDEGIDLQSMLNQNPTAGYSMSMTMPMEDNEMIDTGGAMMLIEETVMVNMSANAAHVSMVMSMPMMFSQVTTMTQVGEIVNVHHKLDGMMITQMGGETIDVKYQTRDMSPNVMEWVLPMLADSMVSDMGDDDDDDDDDGLDDDALDIENATISVSFDSATNSQTMDMSTTNETGAIMNLSIKIDEDSELMSYSMTTTNETGATSHMSYAIMWGDAVVITVDQTLPKTAIPVYWDGLPDFGNHDQDDDDGHDDDGHDDDGMSPDQALYLMDKNGDSLVSWDEFEDFIINYDGGFEDDQDRSETQDHFNYSDTNDDGYLDYDELSNWIDSMEDDDSEMWICDNGEEIPQDYVNDGDEDCSDGSDEYDNDGSDEDDNEPRDLSLTIADNQTFEAPLSDFSINFLSCNSDEISECMVEGEASLSSLTGQIGNSTYVYTDVDMDGMISAGDTLELTGMHPDYQFDLYDSWSDSYVSESGVNAPNMPGFGGLLATISMLGAAFLLPRRDD